MGSMKTPGVYIIEKNAFPNSVVEAPTAIPAFIGYTKQAVNGNNDLKNVPWKISSMTEYIQYFGGGPDLKFEVDIKDGSLCNRRKEQLYIILQHDAVLCQWWQYLLHCFSWQL